MSDIQPKMGMEAPPMTNPKDRLKSILQSMPTVWSAYWRTKQEIRRVYLMRYFFYDMAHTYRAMYWVQGHSDVRTLSAELLFLYHKLEKGLVMPGPRRLFGVEPAKATISLVRRWIEAGHSQTDPVFKGALQTLADYARHIELHQLDINGRIQPEVSALMNEIPLYFKEPSTPQPLPIKDDGREEVSTWSFMELALARRSVREFLPDDVDIALIEGAVVAAQLSPSACNRQPCKLFLTNDPAKKRKLLAYQNGNRGFGHLVPHIAILTTDEQCFFDASERHEPYIDGGLFAMSFILALRANGVQSCCLNWCVPPATDRAVHLLFGIPASQRIVMLIAIGYAPKDCMVPRSPRRALSEVLNKI